MLPAADAVAEKQADASEKHKFRKKACRSRQKAEAARDLAIEKASEAGLEPEGLEPQATDAMPQRGLAHRADGSPKTSAQVGKSRRCGPQVVQLSETLWEASDHHSGKRLTARRYCPNG